MTPRFRLDSVAGEPGTIYVLHFSEPLGDPAKSHGWARHYIGWTNGVSVERRLAEHQAGRGAAITADAARAGIEMVVVHTEPGTRHDERRIKNRKKSAARFCPLCQR